MSDLQEEVGWIDQGFSRPKSSRRERRRRRRQEAEAEAEAGARAQEEAEAEAEAEPEAKDYEPQSTVFRKREATASLCLPIDKNLVGALIGYRGSTVRAIEQLTSTHISIKERGDQQSVYIYGSYEACGRGLDVIECVLGWYQPTQK